MAQLRVTFFFLQKKRKVSGIAWNGKNYDRKKTAKIPPPQKNRGGIFSPRKVTGIVWNDENLDRKNTSKILPKKTRGGGGHVTQFIFLQILTPRKVGGRERERKKEKKTVLIDATTFSLQPVCNATGTANALRLDQLYGGSNKWLQSHIVRFHNYFLWDLSISSGLCLLGKLFQRPTCHLF